MYSVAGGMQVYSVTNYSTCCFLLHLQLSKHYTYKGAEFGFNIPLIIMTIMANNAMQQLNVDVCGGVETSFQQTVAKRHTLCVVVTSIS